MNRIVQYGFTISILLYAILYLFSFFMDKGWMLQLMSTSGMLALHFALILLKPKNSPVPYFLTIASIFIGYITLGSELWMQLWEGIREMRGIILLLLVIPMISWVLREENYIEALIGSAKNLLKTSKRFYAGVMFITQFVAYFLLFSAIPVLFQFIQVLLGNKKDEDWEYFKGTALLRGFGLSTIWVISIPSVVFIIESTGASLGFTLFQGFFISICGILLSLLFMIVHEKRSGLDYTTGILHELHQNMPVNETKRNHFLTREFALLFLTLFGPVLVINHFMDWGLLMIISMCVLVWSCFYYVIKKKWSHLKQHCINYLREEVSQKSQELGIMLSAGMLINVFIASGGGTWAVNTIIHISDSTFIHMFWLLPFLVIFLGFIGLGPLTVMVLVGGIFQGVNLPYPPELIVLSLTLGSAITVFLSPFILPLIVLSQSNHLALWKNGLKFNLGYSVAFYVMVQVYLLIMLWLW
ncbi:hypothetical protein HUG15_18285 [Salicibibacter cibarius]|uniref:DUF401 family protein n=1 Tax=Salicibibacter cibarius TaxID=2743000 RepID=A0A7T6Z5R9_9BACI|nr:hypothetical protein [Salicibibacter cibarius]QQK77333.1 hypothetical protein HUG15_18285 [Salicibibacter cibarius]